MPDSFTAQAAPTRPAAAGHGAGDGITRHDDIPVEHIPPGHVGPFVMPGTGRTVWWTGRVAIGLRHQPRTKPSDVVLSASSVWLQRALLRRRNPQGSVGR
ncbi:hypothetical protein [Aquabacterium sp. J223]|uniref:hypothetical protein n=1 Tax=Aquabacterium sp. J223 TaxID=2898431 RepID=UPI0021ADACFC|nr:hypothetical protein [Aquabacterium sp. J223]UUX94831.1 hypothetical protein LRS07_16340 [Aquabacterium sp. J223]